MIINHNMNAMNAHRNMMNNVGRAGKSMEKLSSGSRINRAGDDAAGLAISEKMRGQIRGLDQAARNGQDGISMIQTAEGALNETHSILQRMRELAVQGANGTNTDADRGRIQDEITQLTDEINRVGNNTEFNTQKLIDGSKNLTEKQAAVKNASSINKIGTGDDKLVIRDAATKGEAAGAVLQGSVTIHDGKEASYTLGKLTSTGSDKTEISTAITKDANELTVSIDGVVRTIKLDEAQDTNAKVATDMQTKLRAAFDRAADGSAAESGAKLTHKDIVVTFDGAGKLMIKDDAANKGAGSKIDIVGGNAASVLSSTDDVKAYGEAANNKLDITYNDGTGDTKVTATIANGTYNTAKELAAKLEAAANTALAGDAAKVTFAAEDGANKNVTVTTEFEGKGAGIVSFGGSAAAFTGLIGDGSSITLGENANDKFDIRVDGENYNVTLADGDYTDKDLLAAQIEKSINDQIKLGGSDRELVEVKALGVADTDRVRFQVTSGSEGKTSDVQFTAVAKNDGMSTLGFNNLIESGKDGEDASVSYQIGANKGQSLKLGLNDMRASALGISGAKAGDENVTEIDKEVVDVTYGEATVKNGDDTEHVVDVTNVESANKAVEVINNAIEMVSKERSNLGAMQNRLEHTINNLSTSSENLTAAESRIRDVDMAKEMMNFSKENILQQAAQAMLAQAKQAPQGVLQLLR